MARGTLHKLKAHPVPFRAVAAGLKRAEFRRNDRGFKVGDELLLREWCPLHGYSGNMVTVSVSHVQDGFGIPPGFVVLSVVQASAALSALVVLAWPWCCDGSPVS